MSREFLPVLESDGNLLKVKGKIERSKAHGKTPVFHATAIIAAILPDGRMLLADKTEKQNRKYLSQNKPALPPGCRIYDCFGGHMRYEDIPENELASGVSMETFKSCAMREFSEELLIKDENNNLKPFTPKESKMIPLGMYEMANDHNCEYSWVFVYKLESFGPYFSEDSFTVGSKDEIISQPVIYADSKKLMDIYLSHDPLSRLSDAAGRVIAKDGIEAFERYMVPQKQ